MPTFYDREQTAWIIVLDFGLLRRIKRELSVDLLRVVDDPQSLEQLGENIETLVNVVWLCVETQAEKMNLTDEDFGSRLDGEAIDQATRALLEALVDFFPSNRRPILRKLIEKTTAIETATLAAINQAIDDGAIEKAMAAPGN